ncbi:MAG: cyclic pyranopterin monophosphate synthase MoaC [Gemmatimonadaceae bacterium]
MKLTHTDASGQARMVNVGGKPATARFARARGVIQMQQSTLSAIRDNTLKKGDALSVARIAGIMAAKRTSDLVPLCHQIPLADVQVQCTLDDALPGVCVEATAETTAQTGVEMEALVAVSVTLVTIFDMAKGIDKTMEIGQISVTEKRGGKSGDWSKP